VNLSSEEKLLLACARTHMDDGHKSMVQEILNNNNLDWNYIKENALKQRIAPLLYYNLKKLDNQKVPDKVVENLEKIYNKIFEWNSHHLEEFERVAIALKESGIEIIVLKGAVLSKLVYPDVGLRPFRDIDFLIREEDLSKVKKVLTHLDYVEHLWTGEKEEERFEYEVGYVNSKKRSYLDIHWDIKSPYAPYKTNVDNLWKTAGKAKIGASQVLTLSPEDNLHFLALHFVKHSKLMATDPVILRFFCDILEIIRVYEHDIDWDYIVKNAKKYGIKTPTYFSLYYTQELLEAPIPPDVISELKPGYFREKVFGIFFNEESVIIQKRGRKNLGFLTDFLMTDSILDGFRFLWNRIFPPLEWISYKYSLPKSKKLYLTRLRLLGLRGIDIFMSILKKSSK
jgi:hypothetical protein